MGWYSPFPEEVGIIIELAETRPLGSKIVEIGSYEGDTTIELAKAFPFSKIIAIDPWDNKQDGSGEVVYKTFTINTREYSNISHIRRRSHKVKLEGVGFVFHDGDHRKPDFQRWYDMLIPGGILVVHDIHDKGWPEVRKAFDALPEPKREYVCPRPDPAFFSAGPRGLGVVFK